jgi:hypothetical protein
MNVSGLNVTVESALVLVPKSATPVFRGIQAMDNSSIRVRSGHYLFLADDTVWEKLRMTMTALSFIWRSRA